MEPDQVATPGPAGPARITDSADEEIRLVLFLHGYGTREGWAHNDRTFRWELHDMRGKVRAWITDEAVFGMLGHPAEHRWKVQKHVIDRFGVPLPVLEPESLA